MAETAARWVKISAVVPADAFIVWQTVVEKLYDEGIDHPNELVKNGFIVEILCAEFLGGP